MSTLVGTTAAELARLLAAREVSSVEVTRAHLDRIAEVDGEIHAWIRQRIAARR